MFKYLFQSLNEKLNGILAKLPESYGTKQQETLERELRELREISDGIIEEWLLFEEKLGKAAKVQPAVSASGGAALHGFAPGAAHAANASALFEPDGPERSMQYQRGEGYFKLAMFAEAAREFGSVVRAYPECLQARFYLALCFLQNEKITDAQSELLALIALADDGKLKAAAYNALGCVQAMQGDVETACNSFRTSHALDPNYEDPIYNLKACQIDGGVLQLGVAIG